MKFVKLIFVSTLLCSLPFSHLTARTNPSQPAKTVLITGAFDGIGKATAQAFAQKGWQVWATDQSINNTTFKAYPNVHVLKLDVTDEFDIQQAVDSILAEQPNIDVLINNAGYGLIGAQEAVSKEEIQHQFEVNVYGPIMLTQAVLPSMRENKQGHIINVSSTSGMRAIPGLGTYAASKFAMEAISEALASEVSHWNIKVSVIEPGTVYTNWANHSVLTEKSVVKDYDKLANNLQRYLTKRLIEGQPPEEVAELITKVVDDPNPHFRYQTSHHAREIASVKWRDVTGDTQIKQQKIFVEELYS
ncbi:SDR family oxidoreductase [Candidatus Berkiella cookevillensis]|uniref:Cyclopentanol dehydrogenase n=1 Tax=Candidatus Berkiella cookevillensis TaxID=437022 RepID=A0A0Q9YBN6_9GAMM|nr:SDR family oxidoreductase [Candidatus Berkiella cookevillensis]MCS5709170.1 SDR family oxidoreductase [Candidatus Berkiella cookevillensis]